MLDADATKLFPQVEAETSSKGDMVSPDAGGSVTNQVSANRAAEPPAEHLVTCPECYGERVVSYVHMSGYVGFANRVTVTCDVCGGRGQVWSDQ